MAVRGAVVSSYGGNERIIPIFMPLKLQLANSARPVHFVCLPSVLRATMRVTAVTAQTTGTIPRDPASSAHNSNILWRPGRPPLAIAENIGVWLPGCADLKRSIQRVPQSVLVQNWHIYCAGISLALHLHLHLFAFSRISYWLGTAKHGRAGAAVSPTDLGRLRLRTEEDEYHGRCDGRGVEIAKYGHHGGDEGRRWTEE